MKKRGAGVEREYWKASNMDEEAYFRHATQSVMVPRLHLFEETLSDVVEQLNEATKQYSGDIEAIPVILDLNGHPPRPQFFPRPATAETRITMVLEDVSLLDAVLRIAEETHLDCFCDFMRKEIRLFPLHSDPPGISTPSKFLMFSMS